MINKTTNSTNEITTNKEQEKQNKRIPQEFNLENYTKKGILNLAKDFLNHNYKHNRDEIMAIVLKCQEEKDKYGERLPASIGCWGTVVDLRKILFIIVGLITECIDKSGISYDEIRKVLDTTFIKDSTNHTKSEQQEDK